MTRQHLLDIVGCLERANSALEGQAALSSYFGTPYICYTIYSGDVLVGVMAEVECMGQVLFVNTLWQYAYDIHDSGNYVYMSYELSEALRNLFASQRKAEKTP